MKIETGKRYVRRDGKVTGPLENTELEAYPFEDPINHFTYTREGEYDINGKPCQIDLVSEYIEPEAVANETKTLWDEYAMAALSSIPTRNWDTEKHTGDEIIIMWAKCAGKVADAMLAIRKERA